MLLRGGLASACAPRPYGAGKRSNGSCLVLWFVVNRSDGGRLATQARLDDWVLCLIPSAEA